MRAYQSICAALAVLAMVSVTVPAAGARQCLSPSPTTLSGKKSYAPIEVRDLTRDEQQRVEQLLKSLDGDWHGTGGTFFCRSISDPDDVESTSATIRATAQVDYYGNFSMTADLTDHAANTSYQRTVRLYLDDHRLRIDHDTGAGDVQLIEITDHTIAFLYRRVNPTGQGSGSTRSEYFFTLHREGDRLTIEQNIYVQAKLSSGYRWVLQR